MPYPKGWFDAGWYDQDWWPEGVGGGAPPVVPTPVGALRAHHARPPVADDHGTHYMPLWLRELRRKQRETGVNRWPR